MKKLPMIAAIPLLWACSGTPSTGNETELTEQEEAELVETISADLDEAQETLRAETEESLNEIDSLLENF